MSWVTIIWSMVASACLTLGGMHLLIWFKQQRVWANLLFFLTAAGTSGFAAGEFWMMRSETTAQFGTAMRFAQVPVWVLGVALIILFDSICVPGDPGSDGLPASQHSSPLKRRSSIRRTEQYCRSLSRK